MRLLKLISLGLCLGGRIERRIIRGQEARPFAYRFMVSIHYEDEHTCGGTLYKKDTVITAAHCKERHLHLFDVLVHRHDFEKTDEEENGSRYKISEFIQHPEYSLIGVKNDIAIVKLHRKGSVRTRVILDDANLGESSGLELKILGWGMMEDGEYPSTLQETQLPVLDFNYCRNQYATLGFQANETIVFCAGFARAQSDTCNADSGGPAFIRVDTNVILVGVVSWGKGCAQDGFPGFYARVTHFIPWILENV